MGGGGGEGGGVGGGRGGGREGERERERGRRDIGRETAHGRVWPHSRLSGSDSDGLLFFLAQPPD